MKARIALGGLLSFATVSLLLVASSTLQLLKDGGARPEGYEYIAEYSGLLNYVVPAWLALALVVLAVLLLRKPRALLRTRGHLPVLFGVLAVISSLWAPDPGSSFRSATLLLSGVTLLLFYSNQVDSRTQYRTLLYFLSALSVASAVASVAVPAYGISVGTHEGAWQGIFSHKNELGAASVLTLAVSLGYANIKRNWKTTAISLLSILLILCSRSTTAMLVASLLLAAHVLLRFNAVTRMLRHSTLLLVVILLVSLPASVVVSNSQSFSIGSKDSSFSGRTYIWGYFLTRIAERPLLGHGYNAYRSIVSEGIEERSIRKEVGFMVSSSHNGYLDVAFSNGLAGLVLFVAIVFSMIRTSRKGEHLIPTLFVAVAYLLTNQLESKGASFTLNFFAIVLLYGAVHKEASELESDTGGRQQ